MPVEKLPSPPRGRGKKSGPQRLDVWHPLSVAMVVVVAYLPSLSGHFELDDHRSIVGNPTIRSITKPMDWLHDEYLGITRPVILATFQWNYACFGLDPWGYHLTNAGIHLASALLVLSLLRIVFRSPSARPYLRSRPESLALATAMVWAAHPIHVNAVTYVVQRCESLMGLFFLGSLYCIARGASGRAQNSKDFAGDPNETNDLSPRPNRWCNVWYCLAILCAVGAVGSKEVGVTLPIVAIFFDRTFLAGSFREVWRRRLPVHLGLIATWAVLAMILWGSRHATEWMAYERPKATPWAYLLTQSGVLLHYVRLLVWPYPLSFDYEWPIAQSWQDVPFAFPTVVILGLATLVALMRWPALGFVGLWFFVILAPTSSFLPIADPCFEHRMYLPSVALLGLGIVLADRLCLAAFSRAGLSGGTSQWLRAGLLVAWVGALTWVTMERNTLFQRPIRLWQDTVAKHPRSMRAQTNLAFRLIRVGRFAEARIAAEAGVTNDPRDVRPRTLLAYVDIRLGRLDEAITLLEEVLADDPFHGDAIAYIGLAYQQKKDYVRAIQAYRIAVELDRGKPQRWLSLADALGRAGETEEAKGAVRKALELAPEFAPAQKLRERLDGPPAELSAESPEDLTIETPGAMDQ